MVPTQLSLCLLFVPMNPHNRELKKSSSSTHTIGLKKREKNEDCHINNITSFVTTQRSWFAKLAVNITPVNTSSVKNLLRLFP